MIWRWLASLVIVMLLLVAGVVTLVTGTERGTAWLAEELQALTDGTVKIQGIRGTLRGGVQVQKLQVQLENIRVSGQDLVLRASAAELMRGRLVVLELRARVLDISLSRDPQVPAGPFVMPAVSTPFPVELRELAVDTLVVRTDGMVTEVSAVQLAAELRGNRLALHRLSATLEELSAEVAGTAELQPELPLDAKFNLRLAGSGLSAGGTIAGVLERLQVEGQVRLPDPVAVTATLSALASAPRLSATAQWQDIGFTVPALGELRSPSGRLVLDGELSGWNASLETSLQAADLPAMQMRGRFRGDQLQAFIEELRLSGEPGLVTASGSAQLQPVPRLQLDVDATDMDVAAFVPGLRGQLSGRALVDAQVGGVTTVQLRSLRCRLMDRPLHGQGDLEFRDGDLLFRGVNLQAGSNKLRADGVLGQRLSGTFSLDAPQLDILWPGLSGRLDIQAKVAGTRAAPELDVQARGSSMVLEGNSLQELQLQARVDRHQKARADLQVSGISISQQQLGDLQLGLDGTLADHQLQATLAGPLLEFTMSSAGRWSGAALEHRLQQASISNKDAGTWQMRGEPLLSVAAAAASIGPHCWVQQSTELCPDLASWSPGRWRLQASLRELDLQRFNVLLARDLGISGMADAALALDSVDGRISGSATWRQRDTTLYYTGGDEPLVTPLDVVELLVELQPELSTASLRLGGAGGLHLNGDGRVTRAPGSEAQVQARFSGELPDLGPLLPLVSGDLDLADIAGRITLDAAVSGTLGSPQLVGEVRLRDAAVAFPGLGMKLEDIEIALLGDGSETFRLEGSAAAGGALKLTGEFRPLETGGPAGWLSVQGEKLDVIRLTDRYVQASPDITLRYAAGKVVAEGEIRIPRAQVVIRELPESAASPSRDAVVIDRESPPEEAPLAQLAEGEIAVILGPDVRLQAFGLDTLLEGTVRLSQAADGEPLGYGVVRFRKGKFGAYGKELTIRRSNLGFAGPLDNPVINLRADRSVRWEGKDVTAGVLVTGTARNPESRVFSEPAMSEADAISYLVTGQPLKSADSDDRSAIAGAALSLGVQQTSPLTQKLGSAVALDELGVDGSSVDEAQVVAGKQLSDDLYVRFAYGLFNRIGTVLARYQLGRNFSIEAASGEDQSLDLIYSVERD